MNICKKKKKMLVSIFKKKNMEDSTIKKIILMNICKKRNMDDPTIKKVIFVNICKKKNMDDDSIKKMNMDDPGASEKQSATPAYNCKKQKSNGETKSKKKSVSR